MRERGGDADETGPLMDDLGNLLGASAAIEAVRTTVARLTRGGQTARRPPAVLIQGETGTGKGLLASLLHRTGPRARGPFVDVNCAAIPETLLESELFGFERGAFTDARQAKPGLFQTANRGTIFLDEIALLSAPLQAKLLKVLEEGAVRRLGSTRNEPLDVWVVSATNAALEAAIGAGTFRADLYHRLAVVTITLPPLRERGDDVLLLADHFLARTCTEYGLPRLTLSADARAKLAAHPWPGNVRELANVIERAALLTDGTVVDGARLQLAETTPRAGRGGTAPRDVSVKRSVANLEEQLIVEALADTGGNISQTAQRLGISRNTLRARIRKYGLQPGAPAPPAPRAPLAAPAPREVAPAPEPAAPAVDLPDFAWEPRRLALLHVRLAPSAPLAPSEAARGVQMFAQKAEAFGGRVIEIATTGVTAAFGFDPVEDAPRRAALAALAMEKASVRAVATTADGGAAMRAAIHVAQVPTARVSAVPDIDGEAKRAVSTLLDSVVAAVPAGTIAVTPAAVPGLERRFALAETGARDRDDQPISRLTGYRPTTFDLGGRIGRFVGRAHELGFLRDRFETARHGQGQVVALVGEAGIGKSRLLFEFLQRAGEQAATTLQGHCFSYAKSVPYFPVLEIVRALVGITETETPEQTSETLRRFLDDLGMDGDETAAYVLHLLGIKDAAASAVAALGPELVRARTTETLHTMLLRTSERSPLIVAVEDLHWIDQASEEYLLSLVERVARARILLVVTHRPAYEAPWSRKSIASHVALQPLAAEDSLSVIRVVFGTDDVGDLLTQGILAKAEGNPFFLEELARAARDHAPESAPPLTPPDTVQDVLLTRIERLPREERRVLQSAAVVGKDFAFDVLLRIVDGTDAALRSTLQKLRAADFVEETRLFPQAEYTFKHALTHEVAYENLPAEERRLLHAKTLDAIERLYSDRLGELVERLAHHALRGEVWISAVRYLRAAGTKAAARSANREAAGYYEQALDVLARLSPENAADSPHTDLALDIRLELRSVLIALGEAQRVVEHLRYVERHARALGDSRRLGLSLCYLSASFWVVGDYTGALKAAEEARTLGNAYQDVALRVYANTALSWLCHSLGDFRRGAAAAREALECLRGDMVREHFGMVGLPAVLARTWLASSLAELGEFDEAAVVAGDGVRLAETVEDAWSLVSAYLGSGIVHLRRGQAAEAIAPLERGVDVARRFNVDVWFTPLAGALGYARVLAGDAPAGVALLTEAIDQARAKRLRFYYSLCLAWLADAHRLGGRLDEAMEGARAALAACEERGERGYQAHTLRVLADVIAARPSSAPDDALASYRRALAAAEALGMEPLAAECRRRLGLKAST
jgi:DNA-binding NtrC family response regulator/tetratricopeptide (TPR) repeat protein